MITVQQNEATRTQGAVCSTCRHDLEVRGKKGGESDGKVYCSNRRCRYHEHPHPINNAVND